MRYYRRICKFPKLLFYASVHCKQCAGEGGGTGGLCSVQCAVCTPLARPPTPPQSYTGTQPGRCCIIPSFSTSPTSVLQCYTLGDDSSKYLVGMIIPQNTFGSGNFSKYPEETMEFPPRKFFLSVNSPNLKFKFTLFMPN